KALAHAGLDQVVPVLVPGEPVVIAVVRGTAIVRRAGDDKVDAPVCQGKCTRVAMPHLDDSVVVKRSLLTLDAESFRWLGRSNDINHERGIPSGPLWCGAVRLLAVPQPSRVQDECTRLSGSSAIGRCGCACTRRRDLL